MTTTRPQTGRTHCRFCGYELLKDLTCCSLACETMEEAEDLRKEVADLTARLSALKTAARAALERLGGEAKDGNLGWAADHPIVANLRAAIGEEGRRGSREIRCA